MLPLGAVRFSITGPGRYTRPPTKRSTSADCLATNRITRPLRRLGPLRRGRQAKCRRSDVQLPGGRRSTHRERVRGSGHDVSSTLRWLPLGSAVTVRSSASLARTAHCHKGLRNDRAELADATKATVWASDLQVWCLLAGLEPATCGLEMSQFRRCAGVRSSWSSATIRRKLSTGVGGRPHSFDSGAPRSAGWSARMRRRMPNRVSAIVSRCTSSPSWMGLILRDTSHGRPL